jgi:hypothetical protein
MAAFIRACGRRRVLAILFMIMAFTAGARQLYAADPSKYLIYHGFFTGPTPDPTFVRNNQAYIDTLPFDGLAIYMRDPNWTLNLSGDVYGKIQPLTYNQILAVLQPMAGLQFNNLKHNFGLIFAGPGISAFDDASWAIRAQNMTNFARALKDTGFEGVFFDNENYNDWADWRDTGSPAAPAGTTLIDAQSKMRERGKQMVQALTAGFPNIVVLLFHGPGPASDESFYQFHANNIKDMNFNDVVHANELSGPLFAGMVESRGTQGTVVDGGELNYGSLTASDFQALYNYSKNQIAEDYGVPADTASRASGPNGFIAPSLRGSVWSQSISAAAGLYDREGSDYHQISPQTLQSIVSLSLKQVDRYVWLYTESMNLLEVPGSSATAAPQAFVDAIRAARNAAPPPPPPPALYLSDMIPTFAADGYGWYGAQFDLSHDSHPLTMNGIVYPKGLGVHAPSDLRYSLNSQYSNLTADFGIDAEAVPNSSVIFQVVADGTKVFDSGLVTGSSSTGHISINLTGVNELHLIVTDGGNGNAWDHADWGTCKLTLAITTPPPPPPPPPGIYLSDLTPTYATGGWGPYERDMSNGEQVAGDGHTLTINGVTYAKGLGVHAPSELRYALNGMYATFQAAAGIDAEIAPNGSVMFQVFTDGNRIYDSGTVTAASATQQIALSVAGVQELKLVVMDDGDGLSSDHADWALARLTLAVNHLPVIASPATATPNAAAPGQGISFGIVATDADHDPLFYAWTFGDGATATGATVTHTFSTIGTYNATVAITNGRGGSASSQVSVTVQQPGIINGTVFTVANLGSGKLLDVSGASLSAGTPVIQWGANGGANQQWKFEDQGQGYYRLTAQHSGLVLDISGASTANKAKAVQWPWNGGLNQQWKVEDMGGGKYRLTARHSGKCLSVSGASLSDGAGIVQLPWSASSSQLWILNPIAGQTPIATIAPSFASAAPTLNVMRAAGRLGGKLPGHDALALNLTLPGDINVSDGTVVTIDFAGATLASTLNKTNSSNSKGGSITVKKRGTSTIVQATLVGDFATAWSNHGITATNKTAAISVSIKIDGQTFTAPLSLHCSTTNAITKFFK